MRVEDLRSVGLLAVGFSDVGCNAMFGPSEKHERNRMIWLVGFRLTAGTKAS